MQSPVAGKGPASPALVRYVYVDVVQFTEGRSIEAQSDILVTLSNVVGTAVLQLLPVSDQVMFLPTGDGICICLVNLIHPFDLDIKIALCILDGVYSYSCQQIDESRKFEVCIGINENQDNLIYDIKGSLNVVGLGINNAQRVMSLAPPSRVLLGPGVYERLSQRELYRPWLRPVDAIVKHGHRMQCFEYFNPGLPCFSGEKSPVMMRASDSSPLERPQGNKTKSSLLQLPLRRGLEPPGNDEKNKLGPSFTIE